MASHTQVQSCCDKVYSPVDIKGLIYHDDKVKAACQLHIRLGFQLFAIRNPLPINLKRILGQDSDPQAAMYAACHSRTSIGRDLALWGHSTASSSPLLRHQEGSEQFKWFDSMAYPQRILDGVRRPEPIQELSSSQYSVCSENDSERLLSSIQDAL